MRSIVVIAHNIRSTHNIGSLLRTAEGLGVAQAWLTGYTPYPALEKDERLPHIMQKLTKDIHKTALGAEEFVDWKQHTDVLEVITQLKKENYQIVGLEQAQDSIKLPTYNPPQKLALLLGNEVEGLSPELMAQCSQLIEIPMFGKKESFNVVQAAAMALYHCTFL